MMIQSYKKMTNELLFAHEENVISFLRSDERFIECEETAEDLGVSISVTVCDSVPASGACFRDDGSKFPYGYESDLRIDVIRDGYVLCTNPEEGGAVQMSITHPMVRTPETMILKKVDLIPYDEICEDGSLFVTLEDFLDNIEDRGFGFLSPFPENDAQSDTPEGDPSPKAFADADGSVKNVELQPGAFAGFFDKEDSLYLSPDAFFPTRIFLAHVLQDRFQNGGICHLDENECKQVADLYLAIPDAIEGAACFSDLLNNLTVYEFAPTDRAEKMLTRLTLARRDDFLADAETLADFFAACGEDGLTVIDL